MSWKSNYAHVTNLAVGSLDPGSCDLIVEHRYCDNMPFAMKQGGYFRRASKWKSTTSDSYIVNSPSTTFNYLAVKKAARLREEWKVNNKKADSCAPVITTRNLSLISR